MAVATFGAGCFWGVEVTFRRTPGVGDAVVGYMGGATANPTYEEVCTGRTGHAEVVQVTYDPTVVSYDDLLGVFWRCHDPTQVDRQGPDVGRQYRSVIFYHDADTRARALASRQRMSESGEHDTPIATAIEPAATFWPAEAYHQRYLEKRGLVDPV